MDGEKNKPIGRFTSKVGENIRSYRGTAEDCGDTWRIFDFVLGKYVELAKTTVLQIIWENQPAPAKTAKGGC